MKLTHVDLFSGIGGFSLACRWNGIETVVFCEQDTFCQKVIKKHWPGVLIENDIKEFDGRKYSDIFILTGGFPCQPFSCAGKRRGKEDDRFLWPEMLRVVSEVKPRWVIGENVAGFIDMGLDDCISDLENQGYEVQAFIIPACAVNAPHRRDRVWIVANCRGEREERQPTNDKNKGRSPESRTEYSGSNSHATDTQSEQAHTAEQRGLHAEFSGKDSDVSDTKSIGLQGGIISLRNERSEPHDKQLHGCCGKWSEQWPEVAARLCGVDARVSNRVDRLKSLGNAIVPQVAAEIIRSILEVERNEALPRPLAP